MSAWSWLELDVVLEIHEKSLRRYGGAQGVRDPGLLDSALARPLQLEAYSEDVDVVALAAAYASGIVKNHPFVDGNKRTGFGACSLFLKMNGRRLTASDAEAESAVVSLASGDLDDRAFQTFLRGRLAPYHQDIG